MNEKNPARLLLDIEEVQQLLGLGRSHLHGYILRGELKSVKAGRRRKIHIDWVHDFVQKLQNNEVNEA